MYFKKNNKRIRIILPVFVSALLFVSACSVPLPWLGVSGSETSQSAAAPAQPAGASASDAVSDPGKTEVINGDGVQITVTYPDGKGSGEEAQVPEGSQDIAGQAPAAVTEAPAEDSKSTSSGTSDKNTSDKDSSDKNSSDKKKSTNKPTYQTDQEFYATNRFSSLDLDKEIQKRLTVDLIEVSEYSRPGTPLPKVNAVAVHYLANPGSNAQNNRNYFNSLAQSGAEYASCHFVIGLSGEIIQLIPMNEISFCTNARNVDTISIECCHPDEDGYYNEATYNTLVMLTAWILDQNNLSYRNIIRHFDVNGKICPRAFVEDPDYWYHYKFDVACALGQKTTYRRLVETSNDQFLTKKQVLEEYAEQKRIAEEEAKAAEEAAYYDSLVEEGVGYYGEDGYFYYYDEEDYAYEEYYDDEEYYYDEDYYMYDEYGY